MDLSRKWLVGFNAGKSQLVLFDVIDVKMDGLVLEEKSSLRMPRLPFSFRLDWALTLSLLLKLPPRKMVYFDFTVIIPRCVKDAYASSFFRRTARL